MKKTTPIVLGLLLLAGLARTADAHCQVPCGIYDDHARIHTMREHITTIAKAAKSIVELSKKKDATSRNQLVRWVVTKEQHAEKIIRIVSDYFLTQKIQPVPASAKQGYGGYLEKLARHHAVMTAAMKCKQNTDGKWIAELTTAVDGIAGYWK